MSHSVIDHSRDQEFLNILKAMKESPVLVIGDVMLDRFIYGRVERISPESPVPILSIAREDTMLGGAGNALANLAGLEAPAHILSVIGQDKEGENIKALTRALGYDASHLLEDSERPTTIKTRFLSGHQQLLRTDFEKKRALSPTLTAELLSRAEKLIKKSKAIILSDYGKGLLNADIIASLVQMAKAQNIPVIADPKGQDYTIYKGVTAVTPNKKELSEATRGLPVETDEEILRASQRLIDECEIETIVATRSKDGMSIIQKDKRPLHLESADIEVFDVSGAGDTVIATIAATLATGANFKQAGALANLAGSIVVTKVGTAPIRAQEMIDSLQSHDGDFQTCVKGSPPRVDRKSHQAPLTSWKEAAEAVRRWRARGLKVGFTNGCFDIVHMGHTSYLNTTRAHCDRLVMGLNRDSSVRVLKGPERPVHDEVARATVLGALSSIDMVVLFGAEKEGDDNTACELLALLQPDIYFKGGDYTIDQIPETPTVQAYGGEVKVMPVWEGHSTTNSIKKMKSHAA